jgi:hypothetical protein
VISSVSKKLLDKLKRKAYRSSYVGEHVRRGIATQIRAMRDQRGWNQGKLSAELDKPQSVVSRLEDPSYGKVTVQTLLEVAATFDVALQIRFVPFSTFLTQTRNLSTQSMQVISFDDDFAASGVGEIRMLQTETSGENAFIMEPVGGGSQRQLEAQTISTSGVEFSVH